MMEYLIKMTPLEPYAFGTERTFSYDGVDNNGAETYFVKSKNVPEQTTVLGMLRYLVLLSEGIIREDFNYSDDTRKRMKELVGEKSFSFRKDVCDDFGKIEKISPVFLLNEENHRLIKNPLNNKSDSGFAQMKLADKAMDTSLGKIRLPMENEYNCKEGLAAGYLNIDNGEVIGDASVFNKNIIAGNNKAGRIVNSDDCYFKRELVLLKSGYTFAVYALVNYELPKSEICYMGQKKSAFLVETLKADDIKDFNFGVENFNDKIKETLSLGSVEKWYYALSDLVIEKETETFSIINMKSIRNLETVYSGNKQSNRFKRSPVQYNLVEKGSVFYEKSPVLENIEKFNKLGYNYLIEVGGM